MHPHKGLYTFFLLLYIYIYIMLHLHSLHNILSPPMNHSHSTYILPSPAKNASTQPQCQHPNPATHKPTHVLKPINQTKKQCKQEALAGIVISNMWACSEFVQFILRFFWKPCECLWNNVMFAIDLSLSVHIYIYIYGSWYIGTHYNGRSTAAPHMLTHGRLEL